MSRQRTRYIKRTQRKYHGQRIEVRDGNHLVLSLNNITTLKPLDPQLNELCRKDSQRSLVPVTSPEKKDQRNLIEIFSFDINALLNSNKCTKLFQSLIDSGCNLNEKSIINGSTPLMVAITSKMKDIVEMLLKNGADPSLFDDEGETPLIKAVKVQETQIFDLIWLYRNSACLIDHTDMRGMTVLHWAVKMQLEKCVQVLLQNKASASICDKNGWTPLMFAATHGNCSIARHLLNAGSNLLPEDLNHLTAICIAFDKAMFPLARLLVSKLTVVEAAQYIKRLLDKLQSLTDMNLGMKAEEKSCVDLMTCLMFSVSVFSKLLAYKEIIYKQKVIARVLASCQKYITNCNLVTLISFFCFYCCVDLLTKNCSADIRFVMQFLRAGGPDFVLKIASAHYQHQSKMICAVTYILPIMVISEVDTGKEWLKHHVKKLLPYVQSLNCSILKEHGSFFTQPLYEFGDLTPLLSIMERFFNYFDTMCREKQEETISELLADEERLREKRERKRVKRQQKRQQRQADGFSEVLHGEDIISVSSEDDMSCDELDWDQRHFSDGEETPWAVPFKSNFQRKIASSLESSDTKTPERKKSWTEYYPVVPIPGNDNQWVTVANKRLGSKARIQSKNNGKSPRTKKKKESKLKSNVKKSESKSSACQKNKVSALKAQQKALVSQETASGFPAIKDSEGMQALLNLESFTPTVVWDRIPPRKTKLSEMEENEDSKDHHTLVSFMDGTALPESNVSQNNGNAFSEQVRKTCWIRESTDTLQNDVPNNGDNLNGKTVAAPKNNCMENPGLQPGTNLNHNHNSTTSTSSSFNDPSKSSLPFFMPSIHFQLDWKPLMTNTVKVVEQEVRQFTKNTYEVIRSPGQMASKNSCINFATATKRTSEMASFVQRPILNKPSVSNDFKNTYNTLKAGTTYLYESQTVQTCNIFKLQGLKVNKSNNTNIVKLPGNPNRSTMTNANISTVNVQKNFKFSPCANTKASSDGSVSGRKFHMARFTKDPEFPSSLKAIDSEIVNFIQLNQMRKYFNQITQNPLLRNSVFGHDAFYYASCLSPNVRNILVTEFPDVFNTWPQKNNSCSSAKPPECHKVQKTMDISCVKDGYGKSQPAGGDEKGYLNWKFKSYRWKHLFALLLRLPLNKRIFVDGILLPGQFKEYNINPRKGHLIVLGLQEDGTELAVKVFKNDECLVKCGILKQLIQPIKLDYNFLIQYRTFSVIKDHAFLSMNACECNVRQYIEWKLQQNSFDANIASGLVWHMLKGLKSLHDNNILHGRLKPENLLIDSKGRLLLANYGFHHLCKHQSWSSSNGQMNNGKIEYEKWWQPSEILRSEQRKKYTSKSDIQVAGMVAHFIISGGHHPFGEDDEVVLNIILNDWQLYHLTEEASDIISIMLSGVPINRPDVEDIMRHPYFWSNGRRFELLLNVGSHLALMSSSVIGLSEETRRNLLELTKILDSDNQFQGWKTLIDNCFIGGLIKFLHYKNALTGLILFIYNTWNQWNQTRKEGKNIIQEPSSYFFRKFPKLFCAVYHHIMASSLRRIIPYRSYY